MAAGGLGWGQYSGPSVLSRGGSMNDGQKGMPAGFRFLAGVNGIYDVGLTPVFVDNTGGLTAIGNQAGVEATIGAVGARRTAHSQVALSYNGNYRHYTSNSYFDGSDHGVALDGQVSVTRHFSVFSKTAAGTISRAFGSLGNFVALPDAAAGVTQNGIFDNRAYYLQVNDEVMYQPSARLSFVAGGDAFFVRRQSKALVGANAYGAHASVAYRIGRSETLDVAYTYTHYDYQRSFGESDMHQWTGGYSRRLNKRWEMGLMGGVFTVDTIGTQQVALDPATAALFGQGTTVQAFHKLNTYPAIGVRVTGHYQRTTVAMNYDRAPNPGNGVYLTSNSERGGASANYTGIRKASFGASGGYQRMKSIGQADLGTYSNATGGFDGSYSFTKTIQLSFRFDARQLQIDTLSGLRKIGYRTTVGVSYSPGEHPLQFFR